MAKGYYPFYRSMCTDDFYSRLDQTVSTVVDSDIPAVENRIDYESLIKAKRLIGIIAGSQPYQPNMSTLSGLMGTNRGAQRECTFASFLSVGHRIGYPKDGDLIVDGRYLFEIGGKGKGFSQIRDIPDSFVVADDIEFGFGNKIPLWIFGFLY